MGTVGSGVARLLLDHGDRTARHAGQTLWLEKVVVRDPNKRRDANLPDGVMTTDLNEILNDDRIEVVAQLIGGLEPARTIMLQLLEAGKDVVTANKALLAEHGPELFDRARELGRSIAFEAAVAGGVPIIANISQCLSANQISSLRGILNGTSNYILTRMEEQKATIAAAIAEAQAAGYAEADPAMDVDGTDVAQKLAILAHLAFGSHVHWSEIPRDGIERIDPTDILYAKALGYRIRLLARAELTDRGLELSVGPTLVKRGTPLSETRLAYNAISVVGDAVGRVFFHGLGAGQMPTASAVVADMIDTAVGRTAITFQTLALFSERSSPPKMADPDGHIGQYYLRLWVYDHPGVMGQITTLLGKMNISIASIIQQDDEDDDEGDTIVPLVIMTHETTEGACRDAMAKIDALDCVRDESMRMRVLD